MTPTASQDRPPLRVLSLGAGVQSTTLALMAARGVIGPMPDCAIFADTGWEPAAVYRHLEWLEAQLPFPVHRVSYGNMRADLLTKRRGQVANPPFFLGGAGMLKRQCTQTYKIEPIHRKCRELIGLKPRQRAPKDARIEQWIGISKDEIQRMKESRTPFIRNRWPLLERRMTRQDCLRWLREHGYPEPPKSACIGCPYHDNAFWRNMKTTAPDEWADAVAFDLDIRTFLHRNRDPLPVFVHRDPLPVFVHRDRVPLSEVDLSTAEERGQQAFSFQDECEGMCGV